MGVPVPRSCHEEDDHRVRAIRTSALMWTNQGCRIGRGHRGFLLDPLADRPHRFVRDAELACHAPKSVAFGADSNVTPLVAQNTRSFGHCCIPSDSRSPS